MMSDPQKLGMSQVFAELQKQGDLIVIDREAHPETENSGVIVAMEREIKTRAG